MQVLVPGKQDAGRSGAGWWIGTWLTEVFGRPAGDEILGASSVDERVRSVGADVDSWDLRVDCDFQEVLREPGKGVRWRGGGGVPTVCERDLRWSLALIEYSL